MYESCFYPTFFFPGYIHWCMKICTNIPCKISWCIQCKTITWNPTCWFLVGAHVPFDEFKAGADLGIASRSYEAFGSSGAFPWFNHVRSMDHSTNCVIVANKWTTRISIARTGAVVFSAKDKLRSIFGMITVVQFQGCLLKFAGTDWRSINVTHVSPSNSNSWSIEFLIWFWQLHTLDHIIEFNRLGEF